MVVILLGKREGEKRERRLKRGEGGGERVKRGGGGESMQGKGKVTLLKKNDYSNICMTEQH